MATEESSYRKNTKQGGLLLSDLCHLTSFTPLSGHASLTLPAL